jgi:hypothetical protein
MAQVAYDTGVSGEPFPTVAPRESVPDDYSHVQAKPEEFGGLIARGAQQLGQGASDAGKFFSEVQTDSAVNSALTRANGAVNKFRALRGADALNAQQSTQDEIDAAFKEARQNLSTPAQEFQFDSITRNYQQRYISGIMASHADEQAKDFAAKTNKDAFDLAVNSVSSVATDDEGMKALYADARRALVKQVQVEGNGSDSDAVKDAIRRADQAVTKARIEAIAVNDPARAQKLVEGFKNTLGVLYEPMAASVRDRAEHQRGLTAAHDETMKAGGQIAPTSVNASLSQVQGAVLQQESGNRDVVPASVTGAVGPGQIEPATFKQFARPGEDIKKPDDNRAVANRILAAYYDRYSGDPYRIAVAYFSRPGNVAPPGSPTPWITDKADPTGKTVSSYVSDVAGRLGAQPAAPYATRAAAERGIMARTDLNDNEKRVAISDINRQFSEAQIAAEADARAKKDANDTAMNGYVSKIMTTGMATPAMMAQVSADPHLTAEAKENLFRFATNDFGFEATSQFGDAYSELYSRLFLPPDDPKRINDQNEILVAASPGGGLTPRGADRLLKVYAASRKDPDQAAVNQTKAHLIDYARSKLSFDQEMLVPGLKPLADPKGAEIFNAKFIPKFESAYDAWVKAGKNPWDFLTQENVDKLMGGLRSKSEMAMDRISAQGEAVGDRQQEGPTPLAPRGIDPTQWNKLMATRPIMQNGQPLPAQNWAQAIAILRSEPSELRIRQFNQHFANFDGAEIIKALGIPTTPAATAATPGTAAPLSPVTASAVPPQLQPSQLVKAEDSFRLARDEALAHLGAPRNVRAELLREAHPSYAFRSPFTEGYEGPLFEESQLSAATAAWVRNHPPPRNVRTDLLRQGGQPEAQTVDPTLGLGAAFYRLTLEQQQKLRDAYDNLVRAREGAPGLRASNE